jgi:hypothetical protein
MTDPTTTAQPAAAGENRRVLVVTGPAGAGTRYADATQISFSTAADGRAVMTVAFSRPELGVDMHLMVAMTQDALDAVLEDGREYHDRTHGRGRWKGINPAL